MPINILSIAVLELFWILVGKFTEGVWIKGF
jgi:hypothetical protein